MERIINKCVEVADDSKRFFLSRTLIDNNDLIKVTATQKVYIVVDNNQLANEKGYVEYTKYLHQTGGRVVGEIVADNLKVGSNNVWHSGNFNPDTKFNVSGGTISGNVNVTGTLNATKTYNAVWNDYAELFERGEETEVGDIIALDENSDKERYIKATNESKVIVGVHSDTFAHLIGGENPTNGEDFYEYNIKKFIPVGLAGRVKVKVIGPVKKGDHIIASDISGVGASMQQHVDKYGFWAGEACIGRSLEDKNTEDIGLIKILI